MQALGSFKGRRMLFLGLGTGLGSALVWEKTLMPLELGDLPYRDGEIIEKFLGIPGIERLGASDWKREVLYAVGQLKKSFIADYVVVGGGNVHRFKRLPKALSEVETRTPFSAGFDYGKSIRARRKGSGMCFKPIAAQPPRSGAFERSSPSLKIFARKPPRPFKNFSAPGATARSIQ